MIRAAIRLPVPFSTVFPFGALCLSVDPLPESGAGGPDRPQAQAHDTDTDLPVWVVRVTDLDPEAARPGRTSEARVTIAAAERPAWPVRTAADGPALVVFDGLAVTPVVDVGRCNGSSTRCRARQAYRYYATALRAPLADELPGAGDADGG